MSIPLKITDPAYWMLAEGIRDPLKRSIAGVPPLVGCYICEDPEFSLMGLPLCYACKFCQGHVAADDSVCDLCWRDQDEEG